MLFMGRSVWMGVMPLAVLVGAFVFFSLCAKSLVVVFALIVFALAILGYLQCIGTAAIAKAMQDSNAPLRYAAVITVNEFVSLGLATMVSEVLAARDGTTQDYFRVGVVGCICAALAPALSVFTKWSCQCAGFSTTQIRD